MIDWSDHQENRWFSSEGCDVDFKWRVCPSASNGYWYIGYTHEATEEENCQVCLRVCRLKDEDTARLLLVKWQLEMMTKSDDVQKKWLLMKETWLKGSK